mmetsp:Transcript_2039/g.6107  ORF Transcript_2039/g.6107 Transcript_2039/m.6107 type:complete len:353 (+) Transcript_2039:177-1235(+)
MRRGRRGTAGVFLVLCAVSACFFDLCKSQAAPALVQNQVTPTPDDAAMKMAKSLTEAKEAVVEDSVREVLQESDYRPKEEDSEEEEKARFRTMTDLLAWSVNATLNSGVSVNDTDSSSSNEPYNAASLDEILDIMDESVSETDLIKSALIVLVEEQEKGENMFDVERIITALKTLEELCHSIDNAQDLVLMEEAAVILTLLNSSSEEVRSHAAWTLATSMQNNPTVQQGLLQLGLFDKLVKLAVEDKSDGVRGKTLLALLSLADYDHGLRLFEKDERVVKILEGNVMKRRSSRVVRRALNMGEVLVRKSGSHWRVRLNVVGRMAERVMKESHDDGVRESAAQFVEALYSVDN